MEFHKYLDVVYLNKNLEIQKEFSLQGQAVTRAIPDLVNWQRSYYKLLAYISLISGFLKAKLTEKYPALHPDLQKLVDDREAKDKAKLEVVKDVQETASVVSTIKG